MSHEIIGVDGAVAGQRARRRKQRNVWQCRDCGVPAPTATATETIIEWEERTKWTHDRATSEAICPLCCPLCKLEPSLFKLTYNPMTGKRRDLDVSEEPAGVAEERWRLKRIAYLRELLQASPSDEAIASYHRELGRLELLPAPKIEPATIGRATRARPYDGMLTRKENTDGKTTSRRGARGSTRRR